MPVTAVFATNTSTLPIASLAAASKRPEQFVGLHFFSPVERMALVEVIVADQTSQETLARALDLVAQLRKTPIVVHDKRRFYTSRVFATYVYEGMLLLQEGVEAALIENAARRVGMPVGPLALSDEVTIELLWKVIAQEIEDLGDDYTPPEAADVIRHMIFDLKRPGRRFGAGFYEYPAANKKYLWPGLSAEFPPAQVQPSAEEIGKRMLYIQALETARCMEEGVVDHPMDADLGAVLGWGFPSYTGGTLSLIDTVGLGQFVGECQRMADAYGERFRPSAWLVDRARRGEMFHQPTAAAGASDAARAANA